MKLFGFTIIKTDKLEGIKRIDNILSLENEELKKQIQAKRITIEGKDKEKQDLLDELNTLRQRNDKLYIEYRELTNKLNALSKEKEVLIRPKKSTPQKPSKKK